MPFYLTPEQDDLNKIPDSKSALPKPCTMWIRLWRIQKPTPKKNSQAYAARSCLTWNKRGNYWSEDQLLSTMMQISHVVAQQFNKQK